MKVIKRAATRWGPERRLEFIDFRLMWDGYLNRAQLVDFFGISTQQASTDIAQYSEMAPNNLIYDRSKKTYKATKTFAPLLSLSDAQHYLDQLMDLKAGAVQASSLLIGWSPPCDVVKYPSRPVSTEILLRVLWAIRDGKDILVKYQSMRRSEATFRWISPHALGSDGLRWHTRAWCYEKNEFRDFVLSRIYVVTDVRESSINPLTDELWFNYVDVVVRARSELSVGQRAAIEVDFGMVDGSLVLNCRKALAFYIVRQLQLDRVSYQSALEQPLELSNRAELEELLLLARKVSESNLQK